jgi:hypothetical protein
LGEVAVLILVSGRAIWILSPGILAQPQRKGKMERDAMGNSMKERGKENPS